MNKIPEHNCPETGIPAWCYHITCETRVCPDSIRQHYEFELTTTKAGKNHQLAALKKRLEVRDEDL